MISDLIISITKCNERLLKVLLVAYVVKDNGGATEIFKDSIKR